MIENYSIDSIKRQLYKVFQEPVIVLNRVSIVDKDTIGFMNSFDMTRPVRYQTVRMKKSRLSKLIGILLCHPKSPIAKSELVEHLDYFHHRSGVSIDYFCAGYGAHWPEGHFSDQEAVASIDGTPWFFSVKAFDKVRREIESESSWQYSGESELILMAAKRSDGDIFLDFSTAIVCNLEQMVKDKAFSSVRAFFETIFRFSESYDGPDPAWDLSDKFGIDKGRGGLKDAVLSLLPKALRSTYRAAEHYAVRDISE